MQHYEWDDERRRTWIAKRVKTGRVALGMHHQGELAAATGLSVSTISRVERGEWVGEKALETLSVALGCTLEDLVAPPGIGRVVPLAESALGQHTGATPWLVEMMQRMVEALGSRDCIDQLPIDVSETRRGQVLELAPLLIDHPRRMLESPRWSCMDSPMRSLPTLSLEQAWVDLHVHPPVVGLGAELPELLDRRADENFVRFESPEFVLDRLGGGAVVLGRPGAGKSTFLKWLMRGMLRARGGRHLLPLFVRLRDYARARQRQELDLLDFALAETCGIRSKAQRELWSNALHYLSGPNRETVVLLLDGWDELGAAERDALEPELDRYSHAFALVMTSRHTAPPAYLRSESFHEIADLSPAAGGELISRWFAVMGRPDQADELRSALVRQPELAQLARNPFTTTLLCALAYHEDPRVPLRLPSTRTKVYERAIALIVEHYENERTRSTTLPLDAGRLRALGRLAYWLYAPPGGQQARHVFDAGDVAQATGDAQLLARVLDPSRLVGQIEGQYGNYQFVHATYHEYFVARHLETLPIHEIVQLLAGHVFDSGWLVVSLFLAGAKHDRALLQHMVRVMSSTPDRHGLVHVRAAWLLAEAEVSDGGQALLGFDVRDVLWAGIERGVQANVFRDAYLLMDAPHLVARTIAALETDDPRRRATMGRLLRQLPSPRAVAQLFEDLGSDDEKVASVATYAGDRVFSAHDLARLRALAADGAAPERLRRRVIRLLANLHDLGALEVFEAMVRRGAWVSEALTAIGRVGGERAAALLHALLDEGLASPDDVYPALGATRSVRGRDALLAALAQTAASDEPSEERIEALLDALVDLPLGARDAVAHVIHQLQHAESPGIRALAAAVLESATAAGVGAALVEAASDNDEQVRVAALAALSAHPSPHWREWLRDRSRDASRGVDERERALRAFLVCCASHARIPRWAHLADEALEEVALALTSRHGTIRIAAVALADAAGPRVVPLLEQVLASERDTLREEACRTLGRIGNPESSRVLASIVAAATSAHDDEVEASDDGLARLQAEAARALAACDPLALLGIHNETAAHALERYAVQTGTLVFADHLLDARGQRVRPRGAG